MCLFASDCYPVASNVSANCEVHRGTLIVEVLRISADESYSVFLARITLVNIRLLPLLILMVLTLHLKEVHVA